MDNPFQTPTSDIRVDETKTDKRIGWIIFFFLLVIVNLYSLYDIAQNLTQGKIKLDDILNLLIYPFVLLALYGYAFKKAFFNQLLWKILLPINILVDIISLRIFFTDNTMTAPESLIIIIILIIILPLMIFQYLAIYRYGFTDREPWNS